ncbi:MAG: MotA/TolQ/ExbB proton channel family protein, partial [Verrucomicrobiota bacterium]
LGMIKSFLHISQGGFEGARQMKLAEGVSEALVTTATGLVVGIPALVFYSIFRGRVQKYVSELEAASTHLLAMLQSQLQIQSPPSSPVQERRPADDYAMPVQSPLVENRPDLHGI